MSTRLGFALLYFLSACQDSQLIADVPAVALLGVGQTGRALYGRECAPCHGEHGKGDGPTADFLWPAPRDFTSGRFRLVSTSNGAPTDNDILRVLKNGIAGSAMPSYAWMEPADLRELAAYVRQLAVEGLAQADELDSLARGDKATFEEAYARAVQRMTPDAVLPVPDRPTITPELLAHGERLYQGECAACHGPDGTGRGTVVPVPGDSGPLTAPRDYTAGLLKGGADWSSLTWRVLAGMPGSSMPATALAGDDAAALVAYVQSRIPDGARDRFHRNRELIDVRRTDASLDDALDAGIWNDVEEVAVNLAPLWWNEKAVFRTHVAAVHDGRSVAIRIRWDDASADAEAIGGTLAVDAAALLFARESETPLPAGMGTPDERTSLWHWRASGREVSGSLDLVPHSLDDPTYRPVFSDAPFGLSGDEPVTGTFTADGPGSLEKGGTSDVSARSRWRDGEWTVVFVSDLTADTAARTGLAPGDRAQVSVAIWDGAAGDAAAQKSITLWQELNLAP